MFVFDKCAPKNKIRKGKQQSFNNEKISKLTMACKRQYISNKYLRN